mmetsp:Transcript_11434/g.27790  ORF Transcript_11434/g.27790 Transcript_11434/m.27790 type:complete len:330 (+) Transcript_11434:838-1827(+)
MQSFSAGAVPDHGPQSNSGPGDNLLNNFDDDEWKFLNEFSKIMGDVPMDQSLRGQTARTDNKKVAGSRSMGSTCTTSSEETATTPPVKPLDIDSAANVSELASCLTTSTAESPACVRSTAETTQSPMQSSSVGVVAPQLWQAHASATAPVCLPRGMKSPALPVRKKSRKPQKKFKNYTSENPSRFCHICAKNRLNQPSLVCSNVKNLLCQKAVCRKCFLKRGWDWDGARNPDSNWLCPHCRGECPRQARCYVYGRANKRRSEKRNVSPSADEEARSAWDAAHALVQAASATPGPQAASDGTAGPAPVPREAQYGGPGVDVAGAPALELF